MDGGLRAFQNWMDGGGDQTLLVSGLVCFAFTPLLVLVHELGHASVPLLRTRGLVRVHVGREPGLVHRRFGRVVLTFDPRPGKDRGGFAQPFAHMTRGEAIACTLAGPIAHTLVSFAFLATRQPLLQVVGVYGIALAAWSLLPRSRSDGALLRRLTQARQWRTRTALDDITAAANAICTDLKRNMTEPRRTILADGLTDPALLRAAYLGSCWGDASESFFPREAALDAFLAATGAIGPDLTIAAARALAKQRQHPGRHVDVGVGPALVRGCDEGAARAAFAYGVAVRDIERVRA
jgi:hypothetical protein